MKKHFHYLWYVLRHKYYVYIWCRKMGLSVWTGLVHDLSKFSKAEWTPYADYYFGEWRNADVRSIPIKVLEAYNLAWNHHQKVNPHHWQFWLFPKGIGAYNEALDMPMRYRIEMLADWCGAGLAIHGKLDVKEWWKANKDDMLLHPNTKEWVEGQMAYSNE